MQAATDREPWALLPKCIDEFIDENNPESGEVGGGAVADNQKSENSTQ
jgi:hypothetical protein